MTRRSGRLSSKAWRWGWQGGTGWHVGDRWRATPCFVGNLRAGPVSGEDGTPCRRSSCPPEYAPQGENHRSNRARAEKSSIKYGGGTRSCALPPPVCTPMRAKAREYADLRGNAHEHGERPDCCSAARLRVVEPAYAKNPIKQWVAGGWRVLCHPVPPCHPQRCAEMVLSICPLSGRYAGDITCKKP